MPANQLVQARIDGAVKEEATAVLAAMGLTVSDAVRLLLTRVAREKALPFAPLVPNAVTIEAMKEAARATSRSARASRTCSTIYMRTIERTNQFKRDYKRESRGRHRTDLDASLTLIVEVLANNKPLELRHYDHALSGEWGDHRDCHVKPDLVLIYQKSGATPCAWCASGHMRN